MKRNPKIILIGPLLALIVLGISFLVGSKPEPVTFTQNANAVPPEQTAAEPTPAPVSYEAFNYGKADLNIPESAFSLNYHVTIDEKNIPAIEITVRNCQTDSLRLDFIKEFNYLGLFDDLSTLFVNIHAKDSSGASLPVRWLNDKSLEIDNTKGDSFSIQYKMSKTSVTRTTGWGSEEFYFAFFRKDGVFFTAGDMFPIPGMEPHAITVDFDLPAGIEMYSSLAKQGTKFYASKDLWGNLLYDFPKAYFIGGKTEIREKYTTSLGDEYIFLWFDRNSKYHSVNQWFPSYGTTGQEIALKYMQNTEQYAKFYNETIGPLPPRVMILADCFNQPDFPQIEMNTDWYHYMQLWPEDTFDTQVSHHTFHSYSFWSAWQTKLPMSENYLSEGIPTYLETAYSQNVSNNPVGIGKIFEYLVLNERGQKYGISENQFHVNYNQSTLKVYTLNKYIAKVTNGNKDIRDFARELWNGVQNNISPAYISPEYITSAFAKTVGNPNDRTVTTLGNMKKFERQDYLELYDDFLKYTGSMSSRYFYSSDLLFLAFLDIAAVQGDEWPHYATYPHNVKRYRNMALRPFKEYLAGLNKTSFTEEDIEKALAASTGKDHTDFFEYWASLGLKLNLADIPELNKIDVSRE